jgi:hypothetical protein
MTIKEQTIEAIEEVLKQHKRFYRSKDFPFPTNNGNYSTHQGAVLRYYLRQNGYVNVRVSELDKSFFLGVDYGLKSGNTIILKVMDFERYKKVGKKLFFDPKLGEKILLKPLMPLSEPIRPGIMGMGEMGKIERIIVNPKPKIKESGKDLMITALIDKYTGRLNSIKQYYALNIDDLPLQECSDMEAHMRDLAEIVRDLKSLI